MNDTQRRTHCTKTTARIFIMLIFDSVQIIKHYGYFYYVIDKKQI